MKTWLSIILAFLLVIVGIFFAINGGKDSKPPETTTAAVVTTTAPDATTTAPDATTTAPDVTTTVPETTTESSTKAPNTIPAWSIIVEGVPAGPVTYTNEDAYEDDLAVDTINMVYYNTNTPPTRSEYDFTGVRLRDILGALGVDVDALGAAAFLTIECTDSYPAPVYPRELIVSPNTLLAWTRYNPANGQTNDFSPPRLSPGDDERSTMYVSNVGTITLHPNG